MTKKNGSIEEMVPKEKKGDIGIVHFKIVGTAPTLMNSAEKVNPSHPLVKEMKKIQSKRKKTEEEMELHDDLEFQAGMYYNSEIGPFWPAEAVDAMLRKSMARFKMGKIFAAAVTAMPDRIPLIYQGPHTMEELLKAPEFRDKRVVVVQRARIMRVRPRFNRWTLEFDIHFLPEAVEAEQIIEAMQYAGLMIGLSDGRPRYGRFNVMEKTVHYENVKVSA